MSEKNSAGCACCVEAAHIVADVAMRLVMEYKGQDLKSKPADDDTGTTEDASAVIASAVERPAAVSNGKQKVLSAHADGVYVTSTAAAGPSLPHPPPPR